MTTSLRWRIIALQVVLVAVLAFAAGFLFWAGNYTHSTIHDQLAAQQIVFPTRSNPEFKALPAANKAQMGKYAGQTMVNGDQAKTYANYFIAFHLKEMGMTYSQASLVAMAHPTNAKAQALVATLFKGTSLRAMLLNAYGWWTIGSYTLLAAIGATIASIVVFGSLIFEALLAFGIVAASNTSRRVHVGQAVPA